MLQALINDSITNFGQFHIPAGIYEIDAPIAIPRRARIDGSGVTVCPSSSFQGNAIFDTGQHPAGRVQIESLTIDGFGHQVIGVWLQNVSEGSYVKDVVVKNTKRCGVCIGSRWGISTGTRVTDCTFTNCGQIDSEADLSAIGVVNAIDLIIRGNIIQDSVLGIDLELHPGVDDRLLNILVEGNTIRTSGGLPSCWGISVLGKPDNRPDNILIDGNVLFGPSGFPYRLFENVSPNVIWGFNLVRQSY